MKRMRGRHVLVLDSGKTRCATVKNPYLEVTETQLREQIRDLCKVIGWEFYFCWTSIHSPRGMPDLILCKPPRLIFAELKREKGIVTEHQQRWLDLLNQCPGVECYIWKPSDLEEIANILLI